MPWGSVALLAFCPALAAGTGKGKALQVRVGPGCAPIRNENATVVADSPGFRAACPLTVHSPDRHPIGDWEAFPPSPAGPRSSPISPQHSRTHGEASVFRTGRSGPCSKGLRERDT